MMCVLVYAGIAVGQDNVQKYFNDAACKVKATTDPSQKREILNDKISKYVQGAGHGSELTARFENRSRRH